MSLLNFKHSKSEYKIDYSAFNSVYKVHMDCRSQKERDEMENEEEEEEEEEKEENKFLPNLQQSVTNISGYIPTYLSRNQLEKTVLKCTCLGLQKSMNNYKRGFATLQRRSSL